MRRAIVKMLRDDLHYLQFVHLQRVA
jgi:hypothetical protein